MSFPASYFIDIVNIHRRKDLSAACRDSLNNPIYGNYTSGLTKVYSQIGVRLAMSSKDIEFAPTGERIKPQGVMYIPADYILKYEDRVVTSDGIEYVVVDIVPAYSSSSVISHYEAKIELP